MDPKIVGRLSSTLNRRCNIEYSYTFLNGIFEVVISGLANPESYFDLLNELTSHEQWGKSSLVVSDERALETSQLKTADLERIAGIFEAMRTKIGGAKFATIAPEDLVFGMNRMWEVHVESKSEAECRVFRNRKEAMAWLSV